MGFIYSSYIVYLSTGFTDYGVSGGIAIVITWWGCT